jgi:SAM-dependent methyltransferase
MTLSGAIYDGGYCDVYGALYIDRWPEKHATNLAILDFLIGDRGETRWLDLACGQAWHFARMAGRARMTGIDASPAQLARARAAAPHAVFMEADLRAFAPKPGSFDLVTLFWGAYCYLAEWEQMARMIERAVAGVAPGGSLYIEVLPIEAIPSFNACRFAAETGFRARRVGHSQHWIYRDRGGFHRMLSPPAAAFIALLADRFETVRLHDDGRFMRHLVAHRRTV